MKRIAIIASTSALHLVHNKAPHEQLVEVGTKAFQFYGISINPADWITQGYSWQVVGNVKLE